MKSLPLLLSVVTFHSKKYDREFLEKLSTNVTGFDGKKYICERCNAQTKKPPVSCQIVINSLYLDNMPEELGCLHVIRVQFRLQIHHIYIVFFE